MLFCHLPQGRCGLKSVEGAIVDTVVQSPSARKVWIEILRSHTLRPACESPSARKVWIEIYYKRTSQICASVTFRKEGVDWNWKYRAVRSGADVTFRKEGVDWNKLRSKNGWKSISSPSARKVWIEMLLTLAVKIWTKCHLPQGRCGLKSCACLSNLPWTSVTFRKEGVDWNPPTIADIRKRCGHLPQGRCGLKCTITTTTVNTARSSPSARKVWIEITCAYCHSRQQKSPSARKVWIEIWKRDANRTGRMSPSARKVWIEIACEVTIGAMSAVTFRKEGVDWNLHHFQMDWREQVSPSARKVWIEISFYGHEYRQWTCHLPQGRCGLK